MYLMNFAYLPDEFRLCMCSWPGMFNYAPASVERLPKGRGVLWAAAVCREKAAPTGAQHGGAAGAVTVDKPATEDWGPAIDEVW